MLSITRITYNKASLTLSEQFVIYKIIEQKVKFKSLKHFTENREKEDMLIVLNQTFRVFFVDLNYFFD